MKKILIITAIIVSALVAVRFGITKIGEYNNQKAIAASSIIPVKQGEVQEIEMYKSIEIPGRVQSMNKVDLVARIDGYLKTKHYKDGDFVKKGQTLLTIEQTQYLNALNKARADLETAKANLYKAERDYKRGAELVAKDFISKSTYDGLYADKMAAQAAVKSATAQLAEAQRNFGYTTIESPVDGKIGSLNIQEGNYVSIASGTLATVVKTNPIYVKYSVDSKQFDELRNLDFIPKKGHDPIKVDIVLPSGKLYPIKGVQDFWDNQISTSTGTIDFRATFDNDDNTLIPGDFVKVKVYSNQKNNVLVVPQNITLQDSRGKYVLVAQEQDKDNIVQTKYFKDAGQYENYWIVKSGLEKGEKYISTNLTKLMPKISKVKFIEEKPEPQNNKEVQEEEIEVQKEVNIPSEKE